MTVSRQDFIGEVAKLYDTYEPNNQVVSQLSGIDLTTVSAPTGMGKDSLINTAGVPRVLAETIREPRMNNGVMERDGVEYEFRGGMLDVVLAELRHGEHVQIGMGPARNSFYGSRIANYPTHGPALIDVLTSQVDTMRRLPFRSVAAVFVTAPSYEIWLRRLTTRGVLSPEEWSQRRGEAEHSLGDALADERYTFILNNDRDVAAAALARFATTREHDKTASALARNAANSIRLALKQL